MKSKWYLSTVVISLCFALWFFLVPIPIAITLLILRIRLDKQNKLAYIKTKEELQQLRSCIEEIGFSRYEDVTKEIEKIQSDFEMEKQDLAVEIENLKQNRDIEKERLLNEINVDLEKTKVQHNKEITDLNNVITERNEKVSVLNNKIEDLTKTFLQKEKQLQTQVRKLAQIKRLYKSIEHCINNFIEYIPNEVDIKINNNRLAKIDEFAPTIITKLHAMDVKSLRKSFKDNDSQISSVLEQYSSRYTTKSNKAIYSLMVIALRAELQNILSNLKYEKLDTAIEQVKFTTNKYLQIAGAGNQTIVGTLTKFIGQIEYLFINAVKIEYNYYVKKEQAKQEQLALREQMRQETEERKALEQERKKVEQEEKKYHTEINKLKEQIVSASDEEIKKLKARILELQSQLSDVAIRKEEIANLANGKAGNVYIISNLGSFGENIFKIGMTRRLDPQERINELGSASVPFKFDVHSFIFSNDAVALENKLHASLNTKRVNKVNSRKEFFYTSIDELEELVSTIEPTAEFSRTMIAEQFRQSQSTNEIYSRVEG